MKSKQLYLSSLGLVLLCTSSIAQAEFNGTGLRRCKSDKMSDYACGQCEPEIGPQFDKILDKVSSGKINSVENFLGEMSPEMKANYTIVGNSKSTQKGTPEFPRIMFKSPNAELWVTMATDPKDPSYSRLEVMRWDGKDGKFVFQEVNFNKQQPKVNHDAETDCMRCHHSPARPNFDTYVSWAGFIPPRDDTLERYITDQNGTPTLDKNGKPIDDPSTKAYLTFMDKVVAAKANPKSNDRLKYLTVPPFNDSTTPDADKMQHIRDTIIASPNQESAGLKRPLTGYRIQHNPPDQKDFKNFDVKTVNGAGFNHVSFDQLTDMNTCAIATRLKKDPKYGNYKYALSGALTCYGSPNDYLPANLQKAAQDYFTKAGVATNAKTPEDVLAAVTTDVQTRVQAVDDQKSNRHLASVEALGLSEDAAKVDASTVRGVREAGVPQVSAARYLLEPMGIRVQDWSMSFGDNLAQPTYNFSDQFEILYNKQEIFEQTRKEFDDDPANGGDYCAWLKTKSLAAFAEPAKPAQTVADDKNALRDFQKDCKKQCGVENAKTDDLQKIASAGLRMKAIQRFGTNGCVGCHTDPDSCNGHLIPWPEKDDPASRAKLKDWLNRPWVDAPAGTPKNPTMLDKVYWALQNKFTSAHADTNMPPQGEIPTGDRAAILSYLSGVSASTDKTQVSCDAYSGQLEAALKASN